MVNWNKHIRAVVERVIDMADDQKRIILWAMDLGFPLEAEPKHIKYMPEEIANIELCHSYFVGLVDVVPCESVIYF